MDHNIDVEHRIDSFNPAVESIHTALSSHVARNKQQQRQQQRTKNPKQTQNL